MVLELDIETIGQVKVLYDYMKINDKLEKCDAIMGCGCSNLEIPKRCAKLLLDGYGDYLIFAGGLGKTTKEMFDKPEAQIYQEIAIACGVPKEKIYMETKSTNTPENFMNTIQMVEQKELRLKSVIIVHSSITTRRTLATAKVYLKDTKILMTTPKTNFNEFIMMNQVKETEIENISVMVGNIQRMVIAPPMGYQIKMEVPEEVIQAYRQLRDKGYDKYVYSEKQIEELIKMHGLVKGEEPSYFR